MTCGETREYLFAFLDSELDAPLSIELQRHLDGCPNCAREAEIERTVRRQLVGTLGAGGEPLPALDESLGDTFELGGTAAATIGPMPGWWAADWGRAVAAAAALAFLVGVGGWLLINGERAGGSKGALSDLLVADFEHFLEEGAVVQLGSTDRETVAEWLQAKTAVAVVLPPLLDRGCYLVGGRKCKIAGKPAAFAVYDLDGTPASLVALAADGTDLGGMRLVEREGATHWVDHRGGYTIVACRRDGLVYAAVSRLPEERLLCLMSGAVHESD
jgi:anti-sigma factor RsiW